MRLRPVPHALVCAFPSASPSQRPRSPRPSGARRPLPGAPGLPAPSSPVRPASVCTPQPGPLRRGPPSPSDPPLAAVPSPAEPSLPAGSRMCRAPRGHGDRLCSTTRQLPQYQLPVTSAPTPLRTASSGRQGKHFRLERLFRLAPRRFRGARRRLSRGGCDLRARAAPEQDGRRAAPDGGAARRAPIFVAGGSAPRAPGRRSQGMERVSARFGCVRAEPRPVAGSELARHPCPLHGSAPYSGEGKRFVPEGVGRIPAAFCFVSTPGRQAPFEEEGRPEVVTMRTPRPRRQPPCGGRARPRMRTAVSGGAGHTCSARGLRRRAGSPPRGRGGRSGRAGTWAPGDLRARSGAGWRAGPGQRGQRGPGIPGDARVRSSMNNSGGCPRLLAIPKCRNEHFLNKFEVPVFNSFRFYPGVELLGYIVILELTLVQQPDPAPAAAPFYIPTGKGS